jgi:hypothetical protein
MVRWRHGGVDSCSFLGIINNGASLLERLYSRGEQGLFLSCAQLLGPEPWAGRPVTAHSARSGYPDMIINFIPCVSDTH